MLAFCILSHTNCTLFCSPYTTVACKKLCSACLATANPTERVYQVDIAFISRLKAIPTEHATHPGAESVEKRLSLGTNEQNNFNSVGARPFGIIFYPSTLDALVIPSSRTSNNYSSFVDEPRTPSRLTGLLVQPSQLHLFLRLSCLYHVIKLKALHRNHQSLAHEQEIWSPGVPDTLSRLANKRSSPLIACLTCSPPRFRNGSGHSLHSNRQGGLLVSSVKSASLHFKYDRGRQVTNAQRTIKKTAKNNIILTLLLYSTGFEIRTPYETGERRELGTRASHLSLR